MSTQEERDRMASFCATVNAAEQRAVYLNHAGCVKDAENLRADVASVRECVPVPRDEWELVVQALLCCDATQADVGMSGELEVRGLVEYDEDRTGHWTPAAFALAARMKEKEKP